jgi:hypothetical protein
MSKEKKSGKSNATFVIDDALLVKLAYGAKASGLSLSAIVSQGIEKRLKEIPLDCPECGKPMVNGVCSSPASHS